MHIKPLFMIAFIASSSALASDISNKDLMDACSKKTVVFGRDDTKAIVRAGEMIDGFCSGYLQASLSALADANACQVGSASPEFLLSVYQQYLKDKKVPETESASKTLARAFRRIECK